VEKVRKMPIFWGKKGKKNAKNIKKGLHYISNESTILLCTDLGENQQKQPKKPFFR